jgi:hypothetical protein
MWKIFKSVLFNPIILFVLLGLLLNVAIGGLQSAPFVDALVAQIGNAFPFMALFLNGLAVASNGQKRPPRFYLRPLALVLMKVVLGSLFFRYILISLVPPDGAIGNFGFIAGSLPTAPSVVVFASKYPHPPHPRRPSVLSPARSYDCDVDVISSALVLALVLSAPYMFIATSLLNLASTGDPFAVVTTSVANLFLIAAAFAVWNVATIAAVHARRRRPFAPISIFMFLLLAYAASFFACNETLHQTLKIRIFSAWVEFLRASVTPPPHRADATDAPGDRLDCHRGGKAYVERAGSFGRWRPCARRCPRRLRVRRVLQSTLPPLHDAPHFGLVLVPLRRWPERRSHCHFRLRRRRVSTRYF